MFKSASLSILAVGFLVAAANPVGAQEFNASPFLDTGMDVKVQRTLARARMQGINLKDTRGSVGRGKTCGNLSIGQFEEDKRRPREVVIVTGDVINVNKSCRRKYK